MDLNSIESVHYTFRKLAGHVLKQYWMPKAIHFGLFYKEYSFSYVRNYNTFLKGCHLDAKELKVNTALSPF